MFLALPVSAYVEPLTTPERVEDYINYRAQQEGVNVQMALAVAKCESRFNGKVIGDHGTSYGIYQIHLPAHAYITPEMALNPAYNITWAIFQMSEGNWRIWSCYRQLTEPSISV